MTLTPAQHIFVTLPSRLFGIEMKALVLHQGSSQATS